MQVEKQVLKLRYENKSQRSIEQTIEKMKKMKLPVMADEYQKQKESTEYQAMSFDERLALIVDVEYDSRINHTIKRNIQNARFYDSNACLENVNYKPERNDLLELMEARCNKKSTILCSQWSPEGWYQKLGEGPVADAILDRIVNSSYKILLQGTSMREEYSKLKNE